MIYDVLENLGAYRGISGAMDAAIHFLRSRDLMSLPEGRMSIDGDAVYVSVSTVALKREEVPWEAHSAYVDIHLSFTGTETIEYLPAPQVDGWGPYKDDARLSSSAQRGIPLPMRANCFSVFFPWDAHRPNLGEGSGRKMVVKVEARGLCRPDGI